MISASSFVSDMSDAHAASKRNVFRPPMALYRSLVSSDKTTPKVGRSIAANHLECTFKTALRWVDILNAMYEMDRTDPDSVEVLFYYEGIINQVAHEYYNVPDAQVAERTDTQPPVRKCWPL